jgi:hypothetical protein
MVAVGTKEIFPRSGSELDGFPDASQALTPLREIGNWF